MAAKGTPTKILLATDLSAQSDRALDRAVQLAREWDATLHIVHAVHNEAGFAMPESAWSAPWRELDELCEAAERQLRRDLGARDEGRAKIQIERGNPGEVICDFAAREGCDLIVTGVARNETLGRMLLGDTVDFLVRNAPVPVLVVRNRVYGNYDEVLATTDFSAASAEALQAARSLFPASKITLFHAYDIPFSGILPVDDPIRAEFRELAEKAASKFLKSVGLPEDFPRKLVQGSPAAEISKFLEARDALVAVGSRGASALAGVLLGSTASRILDHTLADILVVPFGAHSAAASDFRFKGGSRKP